MRSAREGDFWQKLDRRWSGKPPLRLSTDNGDSIEFVQGTIVIGGLNGAGKSRMLNRLQSELGTSGLLVRTSQAVEQTLLALKSIEELESLEQETGAAVLDGERRGDVERIVGRLYDDLSWFSLEIEELAPGIDPVIEDDDGAILVPHFRAEYGGVSYSSLQMGLGEFSVNLLLWIMEQRRDRGGLTLILDEPDAFLPPSSALRLLARLQRIAVQSGWRLVVATHSESLISESVRRGAFARVHPEGGTIRVASSAGDLGAASGLLPPAPPNILAFCEDELACVLLEMFAESIGARGIETVWKNGQGYISRLAESIPPPRPNQWTRFLMVLDGDQADKPIADGWPVLYLPGKGDPSELIFELRGDVMALARIFGVGEFEMSRALTELEGFDSHDWVDALAARYGPRVPALRMLCKLWMELNSGPADEFRHALRTSLGHSI